MNTLTQLALGLMGQLKAAPSTGDDAAATLALPSPRRSGGMPLMEALHRRESRREFAPRPLSKQVLSDLLWAAGGINRSELGERTAPSAMAQRVYLYCVCEGLATAICAWFDRRALSRAMGLGPDHELLLAQTAGAPRSGNPA